MISLRESSNCDDWFEGLPVRSVHLPIPGYCAPSLDAMLLLLDLFHAAASSSSSSSSPSSSSNDSSEHSELLPLSQGVVAVHCLEGKGRTGTICAAYLLHQHPDLAAAEAIALIRSRSPLSIESKEQEEFLHRFARVCRDSERTGGELLQERLSLVSSSSSSSSSSFRSCRTPLAAAAAASTVSLPSKLTAARSTLTKATSCSAATRMDALAAGDEEEDSPGWYY